MRMTRKEVNIMFDRLLKSLNRHFPLEDGEYHLNYAPVYGGYRIDTMGGKDSLFSTTRRSASEMYLSMLMTCQALEEITFRKTQNIKHKDTIL